MASQLLKLIDVTELAKVTAPLESAWTLPPSAYTNPEFFVEEVNELFLKDWICVGRKEQIPQPGDFICVDLPRMPLVITHDLKGQLHALSRICLHRAMPLVTETGSDRRLVCPYHNWTYELDGNLRSAPMMQGVKEFDAHSCRLPELQLEVWNGFLFVNAQSDAPPLTDQLTGLDALITHYDFGALTIAETLHYSSPWNWKILVENFMEAYHHIGTHRGSLEPIYPARESTVPDNEGAPWAFLKMPGSSLGNAEVTSFPSLSDDERGSLFAAVVFPSFLFAASNEAGVWYELKPTAHDHLDLYIHVLVHPKLLSQMTETDRLQLRNQFAAIHEEDIGANLGPWHGLQSQLSEQGRLSPFEKAIWQLNQHWIERLSS